MFSFYRTRAFWRVLRLTMAVIFRHLTIAFSRKISTTPSRKTWAFFESISTMKMSPGTWSNFTQCWLQPAREEQHLLQVKLKMAPPVKVSLVLQHLSLGYFLQLKIAECACHIEKQIAIKRYEPLPSINTHVICDTLQCSCGDLL